jgi:putative ABC transport system permease protein
MRARLHSLTKIVISRSRWFDELTRNLRYAARSMRKNPGFTAVAVLSLSLGIGANTAVFSLLQRLVLTTLPVCDPERLYQVVLSTDQKPFYTLSCPKFEKLRDNFNIFDALFGWGSQQLELAAGDRKRTVSTAIITGGYFDSLGVRPALGRLLTAQDDRAGAADVAVISHHLWQTQFAGDPGVLGGTLKLGQFTFQIVGVTTSEFSGIDLSERPDVYLPLHAVERFSPETLQAEGAMWFFVMARLKPEVPLATAQAVLREGWIRLDRPRMVSQGDHGPPEVLVLEAGGHGYSAVRQEFSGAILALMGLVGVVFLIACANLATLLFVRGTERTREMSIRIALGAGRAQLIRQWMTECLLLAVFGGMAGLVVASWISEVLLQFVAEADRPWLRFQSSPAVLGFTVALTVAAGLLFGLLPAWRASRTSLQILLRERSLSVIGRQSSLARAVLAGQLAASLVLVVGAVLFARTLWNLNSASGGFDRKRVVYAISDFSDYSQDRIHGVLEEVIDRLNRSPHIAAASLTDHPPILWGSVAWSFVTVPGYDNAPDDGNTVFFTNTSTRYFRTMGIPMIAGRDFEDRDRVPRPYRVVIVNEEFVRHYFKGRDPLGQKIEFPRSPPIPPIEIVGVVKDCKDGSLRELQKDLVYFPLPPGWGGVIIARAKPGVAPSLCEAEIRSAMAAVAKNVPVETGRLEEVVQRSLRRDRLVAQLSAVFGLLGILLAMIGLYGAMAHMVSSRTREIGIRMALGADRWQIVRLVLKQSLTVTALGILIGLPAATAGSRLIGSQLFDVSPSDPLTMALSAALLSTVSLLAGLLPARRAAHMDPTAAFRCE